MKGAHMSMAVGVYLERLVQLQNLNVTQVSAAGGVSAQYLYKVSRGINKEPSLEKIRNLVTAVHGRWLHVWWLLSVNAAPEKGKLLAEALYYSGHGCSLTTEQSTVMAEMLQDPEVSAAVVAALSVRRGSP